MDDRDVLTLQDYINKHLFEPCINWPRHEFELHSYSRWAAYEILERVINETMKLPPHITGFERESTVDIIDNFINELDYYYDGSKDVRRQLMFAIARDEAKNILCLFERRM